jgi:hypothetical protein
MRADLLGVALTLVVAFAACGVCTTRIQLVERQAHVLRAMATVLTSCHVVPNWHSEITVWHGTSDGATPETTPHPAILTPSSIALRSASPGRVVNVRNGLNTIKESMWARPTDIAQASNTQDFEVVYQSARVGAPIKLIASCQCSNLQAPDRIVYPITKCAVAGRTVEIDRRPSFLNVRTLSRT